ncbi:MAG: shikimate dehydrogenase, partial [Vicingaceae bacterium]
LPIYSIGELGKLLQNKPELKGLNVTIPFKEVIISMLDDMTREAREIGAVNVIEFRRGKLIGHNTDAPGFIKSLNNHPLKSKINTALILGTGGASKAICYGLRSINVNYTVVSRKPAENEISYAHLRSMDISKFDLIVHCTPIGTFPRVDDKIDLSYSDLRKEQLLYDLIYNPRETAFLKEGKVRGCHTMNGEEMLINQAELSWAIWQRSE